MSLDRVVIYIDAANLYKGAEAACGDGRVNLKQFTRFLAAGKPLVEIKYFCVPPPEPTRTQFNVNTRESRTKYLEATEKYARAVSWHQGLKQWKKITPIYGRLQRTKTGVLKEKGVDVALALHLVIDAHGRKDFDTAIVVSGDADLILAIHAAQNYKNVIGAGFQPCYAIRAACGPDKFVELNRRIIEPLLQRHKKKSN